MKDEAIVAFDVDETLIKDTAVTDISFGIKKIEYNGRVEIRMPHNKHIQFLKDNHARGFTIYVWSGNGKAWADAVVEALELKDYVHHTMAKPCKIVDDLDPSEWLPKRIYLED